MQQYKILYIISSLKRCGPVNQLYGIIKYLDRNRFEPIILTLFKESDDSRATDFHALDVKTYCLNVNRKNSFYKSKELIKGSVEKINPDLIHSHGFRPDLYTYKYLNKYKHCNTIHNYPYEDYVMTYGKILGRAMAYKHIAMFSKMNYPIACSYTISNKLKKDLDKEIYTIQNGIDEEKFSLVDYQTKIKLREKLNLNRNKKIFIYSGVLSVRKDPLTIIDAFNKANINKEAELILIGDGPLRKECEDKVKEGIRVIGKVDNVIDYLQASDMFISASKSEGLPMAVLEAMAVGLPLILSDIKPHLEVFEGDIMEDMGELFPTKNIQKLSRLMTKYAETDLGNKGKNSLNCFLNHFTAQTMSNYYQEFYTEIL
ncbi:glycosyltransferase family 4 protein [Clostridium peptidivorans]|uniref:glycosyltransferase family 4 protein n=1 Tax=Clostridium peptidivorans TaxID=100174 RepID=UPI0015CA8055|nr:glycosyltransferase family 4 protein [Clostridium peptidivorans]